MDGIRKEAVPGVYISFAFRERKVICMTHDCIPQIGFIGAGRAGCSLGMYFKNHGLNVSGYYSRTKSSARFAASFTDTVYYDSMIKLVSECKIIFITVSDSSIGEVWNTIKNTDITGKIICHTSGALSSLIFSDIELLGAYGYSLHPLCAISSKTESYKILNDVYFTIEGSSRMLDYMVSLITSLGNRISVISPSDKEKYHASAVFASNLVNALFSSACDLLTQCGFTENDAHAAISSLFINNSKAITESGTVAALTGPVDRNDITTVKKHLNVLCGDYRKIYELLSLRLIKTAQIKNPHTDYADMNNILQNGE